MVDQAMLNAIQGLLSQQKIEILQETDHNIKVLLSQQKNEILEETGAIRELIARQKDEILEETSKNLQASIQASEARMTDNIQASEARMTDSLQASEARMTDNLQASESRVLQEGHRNMMLLIENLIDPKFKLIAEGHAEILEKLTADRRVDDLEDDVLLLKTTVRQMQDDISELKKAQ
ncbi:MAG: hypothetical protein FWE08_03900 [Oscillospiraceae bacterium]|nr:hypothetical protein [Oscillospiraceae bacterium]